MHLLGTPPRTGLGIIYAVVLLVLICGGAAYPARADTFVVTNTSDPGEGTCTAAGIGDGCTLREAINAANGAAGADTVDATGITGEIELETALPHLSSDITIVGPGAELLKVSRDPNTVSFRVFTILSGVTVNFSGVSITGGRTADGLDGNGIGFPGGNGGGILNSGSLTITGCIVSGNQTGRGGAGGIGVGGSGGGIYNDGTLTIIDSTISGNQTGDGGAGRPGGGGGVPGGPGGSGGGIRNAGTATLINTTVSSNQTGKGGNSPFGNQAVPGPGGGIQNNGTLTLINGTLNGNATGPSNSGFGEGGGIYHGSGELMISNSTIAGNVAGEHGGGLFRSGSSGTATLRSSIVANNLRSSGGANDIAGSVQSDGYNLIGNLSGAIITPNPGAGPDFSGAAKLTCVDNGGPTRTCLPQSDSPAIDKGKNFSASSTDQRGFARTVDLTDATYPNAGDGTDIGAVEVAPVVARNLSTRAKIEPADNVLIAGFIVTGALPKKVVIRGLGPSLQEANVTGVLEDPELELRASNGTLMRGNDNWSDDPVQAGEIQGAGLAPTRTQESAIVLTLVPGTYTAIVRGKNNTSGVGLVEIYDVDNANSELANISTRGVIQSDDNVMIGGFTLGPGDGNTNLILRALGPSLASLGINNPLADPTLDVRDVNGNQVGFNDNWQDDSVKAAQISAKGLAPISDNESALSLTLAPGRYTAIVRGKNNGTGVGLAEIYNTH